MQAFLHHLFYYTGTSQQVMIVYNKSKHYKDIESLLRLYCLYGFVNHLIVRENDDKIKGSDNHKQGLSELIPYIETEHTIVLDCDTLVLHKGWVQILQQEAAAFSLYGIKQARRGYVHPSCMICRTGLLKANLYGVTSQVGDTLEFLSKVAQDTGFMTLHRAVVDNGIDNPLCGYYGTKEKELICHLGSYTRFDAQGVDDYSKEDCDKATEYVQQIFLQRAVVIIPTYGIYHKSIEDVIESIRKYTNYKIMVVQGDGEVLTKNCPSLMYQGSSKAALMNYGFASVFARYYIFQDRDIPITEKWAEEVEVAISDECEFALCQGSVWYGNQEERDAPGGSVMIEHDAFIKIGGFDHMMDNVGLEDREFLYRCYALLENGKRFTDVSLVHIEHERRLTTDQYKESIREQIQDGSYDASLNTGKIWEFYNDLHF